MLITLDQYYDVNQYNEFLNALSNNGIPVVEYINIKPPYNWYLDVPYRPMFVNFDEIAKGQERFLVSKVQPLRANDEVILYRRTDGIGKLTSRYFENQPLIDVRTSGFGVFFFIKNREEGIKLSKDCPVKIWYFGKYFKNRYRLCLCSSNLILAYLKDSQILLINNGNFKELGSFEAYLNYKVFLNQDKLVKYTLMPYFENGQYVIPNYIESDQFVRL